MEGWTLVHSDSMPFGAEVYRTRLEAAGIKVVVLNKQDSSYGMFGSVEVYVSNEDLERSKDVLGTSEDGGSPA